MVWMGPGLMEQGAPPLVAEGLFASTPLATSDGWRAAGELAPGDAVMTFDNGLQPVAAVFHAPFSSGPPGLWPLRIPKWALDNRDEVTLLPQQRLLVEADLAEALFGDPFALIPAEALEHWRGISRFRPDPGGEVVQLHFTRPQIVYASRGILLSCAGESWAEVDWSGDPGHTACSASQARYLVACLMAEETGAALRDCGRRQWQTGFD